MHKQSIPLNLASQVQQLMEARFGRAERRTVRVNAARVCGWRGCAGDVPDGRGEPPTSSDSPVLEERLLGVRGLQAVLLRPVLLVGLWLALLLIWLNIVWGWDYTPPLLIPGERTAEIVQGVQIEYLLDEPTRGLIAPALRVRVGETVVQAPLVDALHTAGRTGRSLGYGCCTGSRRTYHGRWGTLGAARGR